MLERHEILAFIDLESAAAAATIAGESLDRPVPSCPDWSLAQLLEHLGRVQRFWASVIRAGADVEPARPAGEPQAAPATATELDGWFRASTADLLDALRETDWDSPAWTWWKETRTVGAIARHQVQEAAVHRWDAQLALGAPEPLPVALADDGVDEFLWLSRQLRGPQPIGFRATDAGSTYDAGAAPAVTVSAPASDLVLLLYLRLSPDAVAVDGDRALVDRFLVPI